MTHPEKISLAAYTTFDMAWICGGYSQIEVPPGKIEALRGVIHKALLAQIQAKSLASTIGRIMSMSLAFGPVNRFRTRSLYAILESRWAWCEILTLSPEAIDELQFWSSSL